MTVNELKHILKKQITAGRGDDTLVYFKDSDIGYTEPVRPEGVWIRKEFDNHTLVLSYYFDSFNIDRTSELDVVVPEAGDEEYVVTINQLYKAITKMEKIYNFGDVVICTEDNRKHEEKFYDLETYTLEKEHTPVGEYILLLK